MNYIYLNITYAYVSEICMLILKTINTAMWRFHDHEFDLLYSLINLLGTRCRPFHLTRDFCDDVFEFILENLTDEYNVRV